MKLSNFMRSGGETFQVERGDELFTVEGIRHPKEKRVDFEPDTDVCPGDWLKAGSGKRFYVRDTDVQIVKRQPFALQAYYQMEAEHEAAQQQSQVASQTFHIGTAYGSAFGSQNVTINVSFDLRSVEIELDRAEEEADRRGGTDAEEIKKLIAELREHLHNGEPIEAGKLARFWRVFKEHSWLVSPVLGALANLAFRSAAGS